jgi:protein tyrosine phosphatase (PTP) superfamily phosphohydrolase (DUF442 family)
VSRTADPLPSRTPLAPRQEVYRQSFARKFGLGAVRLIYREWTRIAAHIFPEGSRRAALAERLGILLPDRLDLSWIDATLAVGGRVRPEDVPRLPGMGITDVVDVREEHRDDEEALRREGLDFLYLPTPDTYPLSVEDLQRGARWINERRRTGGHVLVHCEHGVGRSVLLAAAALVGDGYFPHEAFTLIESRRWQASPNRRQALRLNEFAKTCQEDAFHE